MSLTSTRKRFKKFSRITALSAVVLIALVTIVGKGGGDAAPAGGGGGGGGGGGTADVAGIWSVTTTVVANNCPDPDPIGEQEMLELTVVQSGSMVMVTDNASGETVDATLNGSTLTFTFVEQDDPPNEDTTITTNVSVTVTGENLLGDANWTAVWTTDGGGMCNGRSGITGTRTSGGGGGGMSGTAEGLWFGASDPMGDIQELAGVILDTGAYWFVFSQENMPDVIGGILQGTGTSDNGSFTSSDGKVFDVDAGISDVTVSATYVEKVTLSGTVGDSMQQVPFVTAYDSLYDMTPSLTIIAGSYLGESASASGRSMATMLISPTGELTGNILGVVCTFLGTASVHSSGNVYDLSVTFDGNPDCPLGAQTVTGIAVFDDSDGEGELVAAAINAARNDGFVYLGAKVPL